LGVVLTLVGCTRADLGECNLDGTTPGGGTVEGPAAFDLAYKPLTGLPMFEGQALVQASCGNGQFCHTPNATGGDRVGVPRGLDYDVALACVDESTDPTCANLQPCEGDAASSAYCQRLRRLSGNRGSVVAWAEEIHFQISEGTMPPGEAGGRVQDDTPWIREDGTELPRLNTPQGKNVVRNWLACGAPVVARTELAPSADMELTACESLEGEVCRYSGPLPTLPATWSAIYWSVIFPTCVVCHGPANGNLDQNPDNEGNPIPGGASPQGLAVLDLTGSDTTDTSNWAAESHSALVNVPASQAGDCFGQGINVIPNDASGSLMIQKMRAVQTCGGEMPLSEGEQTIPTPVILVIEEWINTGAPNN
jgi:hypothetical protein